MQNSGISSLGTISSRSPSGPARSRFALTGRSARIDARIDAARRDLADVRLASRIFAPHYAAAVQRSAVAPAPIYTSADAYSAPISEILPGERFEMLEVSKDFAWGVSATDGVVGYVSAASLGDVVVPTHRVTALAATVHAEPDAESPALWMLPMGALIADTGGEAFRAVPGGFVDSNNLRALADPLADPVAVAEALLGVATVAGGRSGAGVDAAGLVYLAYTMAGYLAPRFCDLQAAQFGKALDTDAPMRRGDLIYFGDHVAILRDAEVAIHAAPGGVRAEPLEALLRDGGHGAVVARRRVL